MSDRTIIDEKTPHLNLPLPVRGNQLMDDVGRIRESFGILDQATASAAQSAADAERFAEEARATARAANDTAENARAIAASKATAEDVAASLAAIQPTLDKVDTEGGVAGAISAAVTAFSASIEPTLDKVDTGGTVAEAIIEAVPEKATQEEVNSGATVDKYVAPDTLQAWNENQDNRLIGWKTATMPSSASWSLCAIDGEIAVATAASTASAPIAYSQDGGATWAKSSYTSTTLRFWDLAVSGNIALMAALTNSSSGTPSYSYQYVLRSTNGGASWSTVLLPSSNTWGYVAIDGDNAVIISSSGTTGYIGACAYSRNGGASWTASTLSNIAASSWAGVAISGLNAVAVGSDSNGKLIIASSTNGGQTWAQTLQHPFSNGGINCGPDPGVAMSGNNAIITIYDNTTGSEGYCLYSKDGGASWMASSIYKIVSSRYVTSLSGTTAFATFRAINAPLLVSTNGGKTWTARTTPGAVTSMRALAVSGGRVIATTSGTAAYYADF